MAEISAQVSLYPLRQPDLGPAIRTAWHIFRNHGLRMQQGSMSTMIWGEDEAVFAALHEAFQRASEHGDTVMAITVSNACPVPEER